jgi:hypothetical protein
MFIISCNCLSQERKEHAQMSFFLTQRASGAEADLTAISLHQDGLLSLSTAIKPGIKTVGFLFPFMVSQNSFYDSGLA